MSSPTAVHVFSTQEHFISPSASHDNESTSSNLASATHPSLMHLFLFRDSHYTAFHPVEHFNECIEHPIPPLCVSSHWSTSHPTVVLSPSEINPIPPSRQPLFRHLPEHNYSHSEVWLLLLLTVASCYVGRGSFWRWGVGSGSQLADDTLIGDHRGGP